MLQYFACKNLWENGNIQLFKCVLFRMCLFFKQKNQYQTLFPEKTILEIDVPKIYFGKPTFSGNKCHWVGKSI